jgi:glutathione S-transferase
VQRVWISLEAKQLTYQYIELDPYKKPDWYLKLNPRGLIPTLQHDEWCCGESTVLMEYVSSFYSSENEAKNSNRVAGLLNNPNSGLSTLVEVNDTHFLANSSF